MAATNATTQINNEVSMVFGPMKENEIVTSIRSGTGAVKITEDGVQLSSMGLYLDSFARDKRTHTMLGKFEMGDSINQMLVSDTLAFLRQYAFNVTDEFESDTSPTFDETEEEYFKVIQDAVIRAYRDSIVKFFYEDSCTIDLGGNAAMEITLAFWNLSLPNIFDPTNNSFEFGMRMSLMVDGDKISGPSTMVNCTNQQFKSSLAGIVSQCSNFAIDTMMNSNIGNINGNDVSERVSDAVRSML